MDRREVNCMTVVTFDITFSLTQLLFMNQYLQKIYRNKMQWQLKHWKI